MNLISCDNCAVVLDKDKLNLSDDLFDDDGNVDETKAAWSSESRNYVPKVVCPVCDNDILIEDIK